MNRRSERSSSGPVGDRVSLGKRLSSSLGATRRQELGLIGLDLTGSRHRRRPQLWIALVLVIALAALGLSRLRIVQVKMRYALGTAIERERGLLQERSRLTARMRALRDPIRLARRARELGFEPPERIIDLPLRSNPSLDEPTHLLADVSDVGDALSPLTAGRP